MCSNKETTSCCCQPEASQHVRDWHGCKRGAARLDWPLNTVWTRTKLRGPADKGRVTFRKLPPATFTVCYQRGVWREPERAEQTSTQSSSRFQTNALSAMMSQPCRSAAPWLADTSSSKYWYSSETEADHFSAWTLPASHLWISISMSLSQTSLPKGNFHSVRAQTRFFCSYEAGSSTRGRNAQPKLIQTQLQSLSSELCGDTTWPPAAVGSRRPCFLYLKRKWLTGLVFLPYLQMYNIKSRMGSSRLWAYTTLPWKQPSCCTSVTLVDFLPHSDCRLKLTGTDSQMIHAVKTH